MHDAQAHSTGPCLAYVDTVIDSHKASEALRILQSNLQMWHRSGVTPLWLNSFRSHTGARLVCLVQDFSKFNNLILDEIRCVEGVRETRTTFSFDGIANVDLLLDLEMEILPHTDIASCHLNIRVAPGVDRQVLEAVARLPQNGAVQVMWALTTYSSFGGDISLLLLGPGNGAIADYIRDYIRSIEGVIDTAADDIIEWIWMAEPAAIITLCEMFFQDEDEEEILDRWDDSLYPDEGSWYPDSGT